MLSTSNNKENQTVYQIIFDVFGNDQKVIEDKRILDKVQKVMDLNMINKTNTLTKMFQDKTCYE